MPASSSLPPSPHRIGILMCPVGRFLECKDCELSFEFPDGAQFDAVAKQFQSHLCGPPIRISDWLIEKIVKDGAPVPNRSERRFVIVRYESKVPAMASCAKCERKFFTPTTLARDAIGAEEYLVRKFDVHDCPAEIEDRGRLL
jgi:hypothetical protein